MTDQNDPVSDNDFKKWPSLEKKNSETERNLTNPGNLCTRIISNEWSRKTNRKDKRK